MNKIKHVHTYRTIILSSVLLSTIAALLIPGAAFVAVIWIAILILFAPLYIDR